LNTLVRRLYEDEVKTYKALPDAHFFIYSGIFMPTGNAGLLGNHPVIGFNIGIKFDRITLDFASSLRFGSTKDPYLSLKPDTIESHYYFGGYIGLEFYYDLVKTGKYNLSAGAGVGMDGFDTDDYYNYNFYGDYRILTVNGNLGLLNNWFINDRYYIGLSYKYNFVHYNSKYIVNDLSGNFHTIYLGIGGLINKYKRDKI